MMKQGHVIKLDEEIALSAALVSLQTKLPMADSFIYATAQLEGGRKIHKIDKTWRLEYILLRRKK